MNKMETPLYYDEILERTEKAVCVSVDTEFATDGGPGDEVISCRKVWLPLSQINLREDVNAADMPKWLASKKGVRDLTT